MTTLYPRLGSADLEPYVVPFGTMMLSFGRAIAAAIALAERATGDEFEAARIVTQDTKNLPKRMRKILRGKLSDENFAQLAAHAATR